MKKILGISKIHNLFQFNSIFSYSIIKVKKIDFENNTYSGEFDDELNLPHGEGNLLYQESKDRYIGEFKKGLMDGFGTIHYKNGDIYQGEFKEGEKHGKGKFVYVNGDIFEVYYENGEKIEGSYSVNCVCMGNPIKTEY